jgi:hypothetical protein
MSNRAERRAAERKANKLARKAGIGQTNQATPTPVQTSDFPEPGRPFPLLSEITSAQLAANRENALKSTGPTSPAGKAVSSQNRLTHGLARHNGRFAVLPTEDASAFDELLSNYLAEHQPATQTEIDLVHAMAESLWLRNRAQNLQPSCFDPQTGAVADQKSLALFIRYENIYQRAYSSSLRQLLKLRSDIRTAEIGFEAQKRAQEAHQMKKDAHYWEVLKKDAEACHQIGRNLTQKWTPSTKTPISPLNWRPNWQNTTPRKEPSTLPSPRSEGLHLASSELP